MSSLTETAFYTRRTVNYAILGLIGYIILKIAWGFGVSVWLYYFPPQAPPPNYAFGKLPALKFPAPESSPSAQLTFRLETVDGAVPKASASATVYHMPKNPATLLALTKAQEFAKKLYFPDAAIQETKYIYRFEDPEVPFRRMKYDIVSTNFVLRYMFEKDPSVFGQGEVPDQNEARESAQNLMRSLDLYPADISGGTMAVTYLKLSGDRLVKTTSLSVADAIRLDYFRAPINGTQIFTSYPDEGQESFIFTGIKDDKRRLLQFMHTYWPINAESTATYGLKDGTLAWQELINGSGYIARYPKLGTEAVIRKVYLGYYDSIDAQSYLQPIFVFEGDQGFLAYVPAVLSEWTEATPAAPAESAAK